MIAAVARSQAGDRDATEAVIEALYGMVLKESRWFAGRWRAAMGGRADEDDLAQGAVLGILNAIRKFDAGRGTAFTTLVVWWMRAAIRNEIQRVMLIRGKGPKVFSVADVPELACQETEAVEAEDLEQLYRVLGELPARTQEILCDRALGKTQYEIGAELGITRERVRQIEKQAIIRMGEAFGTKKTVTLAEAG